MQALWRVKTNRSALGRNGELTILATDSIEDAFERARKIVKNQAKAFLNREDLHRVKIVGVTLETTVDE